MRGEEIFAKARDRVALSLEEAYWLWDEAPLEKLALTADEVRRAVVDDERVVTWQIDRNVNITNVCISGCKFCNFHCKPHQVEREFITTIEEYKEKIEQRVSPIFFPSLYYMIDWRSLSICWLNRWTTAFT